jgi:formylglycine-generating enzyme required for sulfatase activity
MPYPSDLGQRPLEVREAYAALAQYASDYGREPLLLLMHAAVAETLRADLLHLIRVNFLPGRSADLSLEADVLFSPLCTALGGGYYRLDAQVRWHGLALLRSLYRDDPRPRERRVAELLWRYVQAMERRASRTGDPRLAEFLAIQRWVALAFLEPASAAQAFADALRQAGGAPAAALVRLGGLTSAIEMPLASEQTLLAYARAMDALVGGDDERAQTLLQSLGEDEIRVGDVVLKAPPTLWAQWRRPQAESAAGAAAPAQPRRICCVLLAARKPDGEGEREAPERLDRVFAMIRDALGELGFDCLRLDPLVVAGEGARSLYEQLLAADLVVCDLSAYDPGMDYLLGVCWALRPSGTLPIAGQAYRATAGNLGERLLRYPPQDDGIAGAARAGFVDRLRSIVGEGDDSHLRSELYADASLLPPGRADMGAAGAGSAGAETARSKGTRRRCLVVQAFGRFSAWRTGRTYGLDESYPIIANAVTSLGLECLRFDTGESRVTDCSMLRLLHEAEVVIADVSVRVEDVFLALGIRFALCPARTILIAAEGLVPPQFAALPIVRFTPLGYSPGILDPGGFRSALTQRIEDSLATGAVDSPVYLALPKLRPPLRRSEAAVDQGAAGDEVAAVPWASATGSDEYGRWAEVGVAGVRQRFRWIAPGSFQMGSPASEAERFNDEVQHPVTLTRGFWLADTACTQAFWQAVMGSNPSAFRIDPDNPVEQVSWNDVQSFLGQLNRLVPGLHARLPSEAEWEYACRAGTATPFSFGDHITPEEVNYRCDYPYAGGKKGLSRERTVAVGSLPPNSWGLYEMHGNIWEWCADWEGSHPTGEQIDPQGPQTGGARVLRGGSWVDVGGGVRSAYRYRCEPRIRSRIIGFRLALGHQQPAEPA